MSERLVLAVVLATLTLAAGSVTGVCQAPGARVKISVDRTGIYRLTGADLGAAGVKLAEVAPDKIALTCQGQPVACRLVDTEEGKLTEASSIVFYGEGLDTRYTHTNVYWLSWEGEPGPRMEQAKGEPGDQEPCAPLGGHPSLPAPTHPPRLLEDRHSPRCCRMGWRRWHCPDLAGD